MDYDLLYKKKEQLAELRSYLDNNTLETFDKSFNIEYAHNSTAIEGNTLSLVQTKVILEDGLSVGGKSLREIYEVINHNNAFSYIKACIKNKKTLSEAIIKEIHALLMDKIMVGGVYRNVEVRITGASHKPPTPTVMYQQIKEFYTEMNHKYSDNAIELAAWTHAEFVKIHPFVDGNGRTSRMIMNYQLIRAGFLPISISKETRLEYFETLEEYALTGNINPFADMIAQLENVRLDEYIKAINTNV